MVLLLGVAVCVCAAPTFDPVDQGRDTGDPEGRERAARLSKERAMNALEWVGAGALGALGLVVFILALWKLFDIIGLD